MPVFNWSIGDPLPQSVAITRPHSGATVDCETNAIFMGLPLDALNASPLLSNVSHILTVVRLPGHSNCDRGPGLCVES